MSSGFEPPQRRYDTGRVLADPAFGLLLALAVWRLAVKDALAGAALYFYLILMALASGFIAAAGYFGGKLLRELNQHDPSQNHRRGASTDHVCERPVYAGNEENEKKQI